MGAYAAAGSWLAPRRSRSLRAFASASSLGTVPKFEAGVDDTRPCQRPQPSRPGTRGRRVYLAHRGSRTQGPRLAVGVGPRRVRAGRERSVMTEPRRRAGCHAVMRERQQGLESVPHSKADHFRHSDRCCRVVERRRDRAARGRLRPPRGGSARAQSCRARFAFGGGPPARPGPRRRCLGRARRHTEPATAVRPGSTIGLRPAPRGLPGPHSPGLHQTEHRRNWPPPSDETRPITPSLPPLTGVHAFARAKRSRSESGWLLTPNPAWYLVTGPSAMPVQRHLTDLDRFTPLLPGADVDVRDDWLTLGRDRLLSLVVAWATLRRLRSWPRT